jgi:DNA-binding Lrp family transcriptional regulator
MVSTCTGRFDVIVLARFHSTDHLSDFMKKKLGQMEGLRETETFIFLYMNKGHYIPLY